MGDSKGSEVKNSQVFGLIVIGFGVFAAPLQAAGYYFPFAIPNWATYAGALVAGLVGGAMLTRERRVAAMAGGVAAAATGTVTVLAYLSLWSGRTAIHEIEMLVPGLLAGFVGFVVFGVTSGLLYRPPA